jgi:TRAP-type uncharacterized transport system fused permease subunit
VVLEMARRAIKIVLPAVAALVLAYAFLGEQIPGRFGHGGHAGRLPAGHADDHRGRALGHADRHLGRHDRDVRDPGRVHLGRAGGHRVHGLCHPDRRPARAGAAKVAILSSAFYGSISGVAAANTATTGMITIPAMKRLGYPPQLAAATEAVASTGGQILPPVMGAGIFVMAELVRVPYTEIMVAALLPAILFFWRPGSGCMSMRCATIWPPAARALPGWAAVARSVPFFLLPFSILIGTLVFTSYTLAYAAVFATAVTWLTLIFEPDGRMSLPAGGGARWWRWSPPRSRWRSSRRSSSAPGSWSACST